MVSLEYLCSSCSCGEESCNSAAELRYREQNGVRI